MHAGKTGNGWPSRRHSAAVHGAFCIASVRARVQHRAASQRNPDALLFLAAVAGTCAGARHCCGDHGGCNGNVGRHGAVTQRAPERRSHRHNKRYRDRTGDRSPPVCGNARTGTSGHWGSSAHRADEGWCLTRPGEIMNRLCASTVWGVASASDFTSWLALCLSPRQHPAYRFPASMSPYRAVTITAAPTLLRGFTP